MRNIANFFKNIGRWLIRIFSLPPADNTSTTPKKPSVELPKTDTGKTESYPIEADKPKIETPKPTTGGIVIDPNYGAKQGYNPQFLSINLPLPKIPKTLEKELVVPEGQHKPLLNYYHFSLAINAKRRLPQFTAVNIDAVSYNKLKDVMPSRREIGADKWFLDPRIPKNDQLEAAFYKNNDLDIGHMVRREDAVWGDTLEQAIKANNDTFHLTNACPQHKDFNRNAKRWLGLENYALKNARANDLRISVFSGPVLLDEDKKYNNTPIPATFWKIIVMIKEDGTPSATGYMIRQDDLIKDMVNLRFEYAQFETYQVTISEIESATQLQFGLNTYDPLQKKRGLISKPKKIGDFEDIEF